MTACGRVTLKSLPTPIPEEFAAECPETDIPLRVNGDLAIKIQALRGDLRYCNADKRAMQAYNRIIKEQAKK